MTCAEFENRLTALAAGEGSETAQALRQVEVDALSRHAAGCPECRGAADLLAVLARPVGDRDLIAEPGPGYWATFDSRLAARLSAEESQPAPAPAQAPLRTGLYRVAAVVLLALLSGSLWLWQRAPQAVEPDLTWLMAQDLTHPPAGAPLTLPEDLAALLEGLPADRAAEALAGIAGDIDGGAGPWNASADADAAFDDLLEGFEDLKDLRDLRDWEQVAALADWLPALGDASLEYESGVPGSVNDDWTPFPDAGALEDGARKEFLLWLSEQTLRDGDLS